MVIVLAPSLLKEDYDKVARSRHICISFVLKGYQLLLKIMSFEVKSMELAYAALLRLSATFSSQMIVFFFVRLQSQKDNVSKIFSAAMNKLPVKPLTSENLRSRSALTLPKTLSHPSWHALAFLKLLEVASIWAYHQWWVVARRLFFHT